MNDPHVVALIYGIEHGASVDYEEAEPFVREEPAFRLEVKDKKARFELKDHYAEESAARESIEEYIRVWEFDACLNNGPDSFKLRFNKSEIEDRNPTPGEVSLYGSATVSIQTSSLTLTCRLPAYPLPPSDLVIGPNVQTMYDRYMNYLQGREPLSGMAFFCLTVLENSAGGREAVARKYQIAKRVLREIGYLCSEKGGPEARKAEGVAKELTEEERRFLDRTIKKIIRRVAEKTCSPTAKLDKISLSDLQNVKPG